MNWGASPGAWDHWDLVLGLGEDLLPVVADPTAKISPTSGMSSLGKTPSRFNRSGLVSGFANWTSHRSTSEELAEWASNPSLGMCLQTRRVRAIDCDIDGFDEGRFAAEVHVAIDDFLGTALPTRRRQDADKFLLLLDLPGDYSKRVIKTAHGIIEFLATGQQAVIDSTHPAGQRYVWVGGAPIQVPTISPEQFEALWAYLEERFAIAPSTTAKASTKAATLNAAVANDPTATALLNQGLVLKTENDGRLHITCPWEDEHTPGTGGETATTYWPANTGGYAQGHFRCLHASHADKTDRDFLEAIGIVYDPADDYEAVLIGEDDNGNTSVRPIRFEFIGDDVFSAGKPMGWLIKGVIPKAELGVVYGPPGSGKTFKVLDMVMAIARGIPWCGRRVHKTGVGYIAAEGAGGFRNRLQAYRLENDLPPGAVIHVLADVPNLLQKQDVIDLGNSILRIGGIGVLVYDTLARGTTGGDENSAKDMGLAIANCRVLHDVTGAMVILIHHSGKDASKGARGSNSILGAVDFEIEISRFDNNRTATISKLKDGEDGAQFGFTLRTVPVGVDEDGDIISSCVVEHGEVVTTPGRKTKKRGAHEETILRAVRDLVTIAGDLPSTDQVITAAVDATVYDTNKTDRRKEVIVRAFNGLLDAGEILISGGRVSLDSAG